MSGATVAVLAALPCEAAAALKKRIQREEGTAPHIQKLIQGGRVLADSDLVDPGKPVTMVRIQRKLAILASVHSDLRFYDVETGEAMRSACSLNLRLSCLAADWENSRCFTGSSDGAVRVWDFLSGQLLRSLGGKGKAADQQAVCALCFDPSDLLLAAAVDGTVRAWSLHGGALEARVQTAARGSFLVAADWPRGVMLVAGEGLPEHKVVAHALPSGAELWSIRLGAGPTAAISVDWLGERCLAAPRWGLLELHSVGPSGQPIAKFGPERPHMRGLLRADWAGGRLLVVAEPYALEMWSLQTFELMYRLRDPGGDGMEVVSLDVDWTLPVPQAIVCRHYVDWELVAGEVCIQHWELFEGSQPRNVCADHPVVGGFDVVAAAAQF